MWTWLLNPKNLLLVALAALFIVIGGLYLWEKGEVANQKTTIAKQAASILDLQKTNADLQGQVADYKANIVAMQRAQLKQQQIANNTAQLSAKVETIKTECVIGGDDEKTIDDVTNDFNNGGVFAPANSGTETGAKVLSASVAPNAGSPAKQRYTVKQIVENYLAVINYTLQLEETIKCYQEEGGG
jgi:hypothetical protein